MYNELSKKFAEVKDLDVQGVGDKIGGKVKLNIDNGTFENACALRMSYAFNEEGTRKIKSSDGAVSSGKASSDGSKDWYLYRVNDFKKMLDNNFDDKETTNDINNLKGKKGIIVFEDCGFSNATGHVDLYDGKQVEGSDYSNISKKMTLYKIE
uniref:Tae4 n=1 Tax=Pecoramyces ruminantium TaxID=1987568 RepID=A0A2S1TZ57_9FUNG|nr:Tae4 [Pecoramyces ruminantium]